MVGYIFLGGLIPPTNGQLRTSAHELVPPGYAIAEESSSGGSSFFTGAYSASVTSTNETQPLGERETAYTRNAGTTGWIIQGPRVLEGTDTYLLNHDGMEAELTFLKPPVAPEYLLTDISVRRNDGAESRRAPLGGLAGATVGVGVWGAAMLLKRRRAYPLT